MTTTKAPKDRKSKKSKTATDAFPRTKTTAPVVTAETPINPTPTQEQTTMTEETVATTEPSTRTYEQIRTSKFGFVIYRFPGVRGTVAVSKSMFEGDAPKELTISANWAMPGEQKSAKELTPEQVAKLQEKAKKQAERLAKTQSRLAKLNLATETAPATDAASL